jgi:DNA replication and repair protein RecF
MTGTAPSSLPAPAPSAWSVRELEVADLRCWRRGTITLPPGLLVVCGPNGAGKTSLVEAIVLAALGVSPRTAQLSELVRHGAPALHVAAEVGSPTSRGAVETRRDIGYAPRTGRRLAVDREPVRSLAAWRLAGAVLVFVPEELRAVKGPPAARRRGLDRLLEAVVPGFAADAAGYGEALAQRNALLRRARAAGADARSLDAAAPWEARMAELGGRVHRARRDGVAALEAPYARWLASLGGSGDGVLRLEASPAALADAAPGGVEDALRAYLEDRRPRDLAAGMTLAGPHRDDLWIGAGMHDLRRLGSQGEQRTATLALLMAHRERLEDAGSTPILLLDDVLSELDPDRRRALVEAISRGGQAVVTTADPDLPEAAGVAGAELLYVRDGAPRRGV